MTISTEKATFWRGVVDGLPFVLVSAPFGVLFGVLATEGGLNLLEVLSFSLVVVAGAAQFTALQLMLDNAPTIVVLASALAVNLRLVMYSAGLAPHLGAAPLKARLAAAYVLVDPVYALSATRYDAEPSMPMPLKVAYFFGTAAPVMVGWFTSTLIGAALGTQIPEAYALDFALPIAFIAMAGPMMRTAAHMAAAFVAVVLALGLAWMPYGTGLLVAGLGGMLTGARIELMQRERATP